MRLIFLIGLAILQGCQAEQTIDLESTCFKVLDSAQTGISFNNELVDTRDQNIIEYMYYYNGAGVGTADFDGDGLLDLFFAGNQVSDRVFKNLGDLQFEDVSADSDIVVDSAWSTGVSIIDINSDGKPDVWIGVVNAMSPEQAAAKLYINNSSPGKIKFIEAAANWGLDVMGLISQACWLDYDLDGDLDVYILKHSDHKLGTLGPKKRFETIKSKDAGDQFFENRGDKFEEVTLQTKINSSVLGYGLGVTTSDFNNDGYPDLYVANDFHEDDYLYINNKDKTFSEVAQISTTHTSRFSMGVDAAFLNADNFPDIMVLDMLPKDRVIKRSSAGEDTYDVRQLKQASGYGPQYSHNVLQLSQGLNCDDIPIYTDVATMLGVHATDWSWSVLFDDFNLDGSTDFFVSNGILGRPNDLDYIKYVSAEQQQIRLSPSARGGFESISSQMPSIPIRNRLFIGKKQNQPTFEDQSVGPAGFSHGTIKADFDNDGDVDLVVSNVNSTASIYENTTLNDRSKGWLGLILSGDSINLSAIGAKVVVTGHKAQVSKLLYQGEINPIRGFLSSSDTRISLALPDSIVQLTVKVRWPSGLHELFDLSDAHNSYITLRKGAGQALTEEYQAFDEPSAHKFKAIAGGGLGATFLHEENSIHEFDSQRLQPFAIGVGGPGLCVGDLDGDDLDDIVVGGGPRQSSVIYLQTAEGMFLAAKSADIEADTKFDDSLLELVDVDRDGDLDLIAASTEVQGPLRERGLRPRLYLNDGAGNFKLNAEAFPPDLAPAVSKLIALTFDDSDQLHVLLLPRANPTVYGAISSGHVLRYNGASFTEVTKETAPFFEDLRLVTDATLLHQSGKRYLIVAREFGAVTMHEIGLSTIAGEGIEVAPPGLWRSIFTETLAKNESVIWLGNLGYNSNLSARGDTILNLYVGDFDGNNQEEQLITSTAKSKADLIYSRDAILSQLPEWKKIIPSYNMYAKSEISTVVAATQLEQSFVGQVHTTASGYVKFSDGTLGKFQAFPSIAQVAPLQAFLPYNDVMLAFGNANDGSAQIDSQQGIRGLVFSHDQLGKLSVEGQPSQTGLCELAGVVRQARRIKIGNEDAVLISTNNGSLWFVLNK